MNEMAGVRWFTYMKQPPEIMPIKMETRLIDHCRSRGYSANAIGGGSGLREYDRYYIYMLLE